jgi:PIN domain nuclease of toxin-antitoxin system
MIVAIADTQAVLHYLYNDRRLGTHASSFITKAEEQGNRIGVSSISLFEITYLIENRKIPDAAALSRVMDKMADPSSVLQHIPVDEIIAVETKQIPWEIPQDPPKKAKKNNDPWDRIIAATARICHVPLLTEDDFLRDLEKLGTIRTIW